MRADHLINARWPAVRAADGSSCGHDDHRDTCQHEQSHPPWAKRFLRALRVERSARGRNDAFLLIATPKEAVHTLNAAVKHPLADLVIHQRLVDGDFGIIGNTPEEFAAIIKRDLAACGKAIKEAGIKPERANYSGWITKLECLSFASPFETNGEQLSKLLLFSCRRN